MAERARVLIGGVPGGGGICAGNVMGSRLGPVIGREDVSLRGGEKQAREILLC